MKSLAMRSEHLSDSVFGVMAKKALENHAVNLSQGFPDFDGPDFLKSYAAESIEKGYNQYSPFVGIEPLRQNIAHLYRSYYDLVYCYRNEITVVNGATQAIYLAVQAIANPGDEVIVLEPFYDSYIASIRLAGATPVAVTLEGEDFALNLEKLQKAITPKTKALILNNPHNPSGKVFKRNELEEISKIAIKNDLYLMSDEVYEFLVFDGNTHIPSATLPEMKDRTITISSAGKTFGLTGWKVGWCCANAEITARIRKLHQYMVFCVATPLQYAVARGLTHLDEYLPDFKRTYCEKRDYFHHGLQELGYKFKKPEGTYFMMVPIREKTHLDDVAYCEQLIVKNKVAAIPPSAFYLNSDDGKKYIRMCFAKKEETLRQALLNLS